MKQLALALVLSAFASNALACSGDGYSLAGLSPGQRAAKEAELEAAIANSAEINRRIANLDKAIAVAETVDLAIGLGASLATPYGGAAYSGGKALGYAATGQFKEAGVAALSGVIGVIGAGAPSAGNALGKPVAGKAIGVVGKVANFAIDAYGAISTGQDVGDAFGQ